MLLTSVPLKCSSASRCHHLFKTFCGWLDRQLPDGTAGVVSDAVRAHHTRPYTGQYPQRRTQSWAEDARGARAPEPKIAPHASTPNELAISNWARIPEMVATTPISYHYHRRE